MHWQSKDDHSEPFLRTHSLAAVARTPEVGAQPEREEKLEGKQTGASTCRVCMRTVTWPYRLLWFSILEQRTWTTWGGSKDSTKLQRTVLYLRSSTMSCGQKKTSSEFSPPFREACVSFYICSLLAILQPKCNFSHQMLSCAFFFTFPSFIKLWFKPTSQQLPFHLTQLKTNLPPWGSFF